MNKSKLRSKILNLRKKNLNKKLSLNPERIYRFLKKNKINFTNVGGYYPCNYEIDDLDTLYFCLLYTSPSPRDLSTSRMPSSA